MRVIRPELGIGFSVADGERELAALTLRQCQPVGAASRPLRKGRCPDAFALAFG
jgi:hypothetical protein